MSSPPPSTYSCPHCAEQIQPQATLCRFCHKEVLWSVIISRKPSGGDLAKASKELFEEIGQRSFATYGTFRKTLDEGVDPLFERLSKTDADRVIEILTKNGGEGWTTLSLPKERKSSAMTGILMALLVGALILAVLSLLKNKPKPAQISSLPPTDSPSIVITLTPEPSPPTSQISPPRETSDTLDRQTQLHIKTLIAATATLTGESTSGSAFFIHPRGFLITNNHVTEKMTAIQVQTSDGRARPGIVVRSDPYYDLALIRVEGGPYPTLQLGDATKLEQGDTVWTIGAPRGLSFTVTRGIVSYVGRNIKGKAFIQADVAINPGNSGGPMVNERGEVVGINNFIISDAVGLNFAIPINYIYMGTETIAKDVLPYRSDNEMMSEWRSWEKEPRSAIQTAVQPRAPLSEGVSTRSDLQSVLDQLKKTSDSYDIKRARLETALTELKSKLAAEKSQYASGNDSISSETVRGKNIAKLSRQVIQQEIGLAEETIAYCRKQEPRLELAQDLARNNESLRSNMTSQYEQIRKLRVDSQALRTTKLDELKQVDEVNY